MKNKNYFKINIIYFTAITLVAVCFIASYFGFIQSEWLSSLLIQVLVMAAIPILMYNLLISKNFKTTFKDLGFKKISGKSLVIVIILGFALYFLNSYIATFFSTILHLLGYEKLPIQSTSSIELNSATILKEFFLTAILPGICEEILHRGIMLNGAKRVTNTRFCLITSSILFGLTHLNINQFFYAAILGYLMGYVNLVTNSIYPSIIIHFLNNFLSVYFSFGSVLNWPFANLITNIEAILSSNILLFISATTVGIVSILLLYLYLTKILIKERAKVEIKRLIVSLKLNQMPSNEAEEKINQANKILYDRNTIFYNKRKIKPNLIDYTFLIFSVLLGILITISSFIWGII